MNSIREFMSFLKELLFIDSRTGRASHTKFWSNVGYACLCFTFVYAVIYGTTVDIMIWALYGLVVVGNKTVLKLFGRDEGTPKNEKDV